MSKGRQNHRVLLGRTSLPAYMCGYEIWYMLRSIRVRVLEESPMFFIMWPLFRSTNHMGPNSGLTSIITREFEPIHCTFTEYQIHLGLHPEQPPFPIHRDQVIIQVRYPITSLKSLIRSHLNCEESHLILSEQRHRSSLHFPRNKVWHQLPIRQSDSSSLCKSVSGISTLPREEEVWVWFFVASTRTGVLVS